MDAQQPTAEWILNHIPDIDMKWVEALKEWNKEKPTWCIPRKDTPEYNEVMAIKNGTAKTVSEDRDYWADAYSGLQRFYSIEKVGTQYIATPVAYYDPRSEPKWNKGGYKGEQPGSVSVYGPEHMRLFKTGSRTLHTIAKKTQPGGLEVDYPVVDALAKNKDITQLLKLREGPPRVERRLVTQTKYYMETRKFGYSAYVYDRNVWEKVNQTSPQKATFKNIGKLSKTRNMNDQSFYGFSEDQEVKTIREGTFNEAENVWEIPRGKLAPRKISVITNQDAIERIQKKDVIPAKVYA